MSHPTAVGIIGCGMVGNAVRAVVGAHRPVLIYDPRQFGGDGLGEQPVPCELHIGQYDRPLGYMADQCAVIFICVPTPMKLSGEQDLSILTEVMDRLNAEAPRPVLVVIKSTVLPGTTDMLARRCPNLRVCFSPEFLREATAVEDFRTQTRIVIGRNILIPELVALFRETHPQASPYYTDPVTAEMVKYAANCYLAVKVSFANEFAQICQAAAVEYDELRRLLVTDERIGDSHLQVPGPDGKRGFGMTCFPKDLNAMIRYARAHGVAPTVLDAAWQKNLEVRPERDWELMKGRAVSEGEA